MEAQASVCRMNLGKRDQRQFKIIQSPPPPPQKQKKKKQNHSSLF